MASQIEQLRTSFDKMNTAQKKQFIDSLKKQLQNSKSAEHLKFLQECVSKYNVAVNGGSAVSTKTQTPTASASSFATTKSKQKNPLMGAAIALGVILFTVLVGGGAFVFTKLNNSNNNTVSNIPSEIIGNWSDKNDTAITSSFPDTYIYVFNKDGTFELKVIQLSLSKPSYLATVQEGTYEINGTTLKTFHKGSDKIYEDMYEMTFVDNNTLKLSESLRGGERIRERIFTKISDDF